MCQIYRFGHVLYIYNEWYHGLYNALFYIMHTISIKALGGKKQNVSPLSSIYISKHCAFSVNYSFSPCVFFIHHIHFLYVQFTKTTFCIYPILIQQSLHLTTPHTTQPDKKKAAQRKITISCFIIYFDNIWHGTKVNIFILPRML